MNNREIMKAISRAYDVNPTKDKIGFLNQFENRNLNYVELVINQFKYMKKINLLFALSIVACMFVCFFVYLQSKFWVFSAFIPFISLLSVILLIQSKRYKMDEFEMSCRFSLKLITITRICISGTLSLLALLAGVLILNIAFGFNISASVFGLVVPYLVSAWGCLIIIRKFNSKHNLVICAGFCLFVSIFSFAILSLRLWLLGQLFQMIVYASLVIVSVLLVREIFILVRNSGGKLWNYC